MVGKIESYSVAIKLIILIVFVVIGAYGLFGNANVDQLSVNDWVSPINLISGGMVIFVAYEGFELIANAAPDIIDPSKNIPKAYFYAVIFVIILYIAIATVTVGSLAFGKIASAQDYVLAEAAKPMLGKAGFAIITIAALLSTFSAINASLFGGSRVNYEISKDDELPHEFTSYLWNQPVGLLITAALTLILVNTLNLESISMAGSISFLIVFSLVNYVWFRLAGKNNKNKLLPFAGFILCMLVLIMQQYLANFIGILVSAAMIIFCFILEYWHKKFEKHPVAVK